MMDKTGDCGCGGHGHADGGGLCCGRHTHMGRFMETCVLVLLCDSDDHGYSLAEQLADFGIEDINASTLYRVMRKMEDHGWVRSEWEEGGKGPQRRVYTITDSGRAALGEEIAAFEVRRDSIDRLLARYRQISQ